MAKMEKLDPKETPKVIALGVIAVGMFGYFGMTMMAPPPRPPAPPAAAKDAPKTVEAAADQDAELVKVAMAKLVGTSNVYNPDPFRPARLPKVEGTGRAQNPGAGRRGGSYRAFNMPLPPATGISAPDRPEVNVTRSMPSMPAPAPAPLPRPELTLTGVIDAQDGDDDLAVAQMGTESLFLKVGDKLPNGYKIVKVVVDGASDEPAGIWILNNPKTGRPDKFKIVLGGKTPPRDGDTLMATQ